MATIVENLTENLLKVNEGIDKVEVLNTELAQTLYGGDTGYRGHYDEFWDSYQQNGALENCSYLFSGAGWNDATFKPKYDIKPTGAYMMFSASHITDIYEILNAVGIVLDFSKCENFQYTFWGSRTKRIGVLDVRKGINLFEMLRDAFVETIEKVICVETTPFNETTFSRALSLKEIRFEGAIGATVGFNESSLLTHDSIVSIINALSATTSGLAVTLSKTAVNQAFETSSGANDGSTSAEWLSLIATKSNWTISLV